MALVREPFPLLTLLALGTVPLLVTLLPQHTKYSWLSYIRFRPPFTQATLALSRESHSSAAHFCGLVFAAATDLAPFGRLPASSVVGLNHRLVPLLPGNFVEQCVNIMRYEVK